jgi:DNA polymerase-3 subunit alpha
MFSDPSGQFEAVIFSDTLAQARDLLEPGTPVLLTVEAERDGESVKLRVQHLEALDKAAGAVQRGLKVVLAGEAVIARQSEIASIKELLKPGRGEIRLVLRLDEKGRDVELAVPGRYEVNPMLKGTLSTVPGVLEVLDL